MTLTTLTNTGRQVTDDSSVIQCCSRWTKFKEAKEMEEQRGRKTNTTVIATG